MVEHLKAKLASNTSLEAGRSWLSTANREMSGSSPGHRKMSSKWIGH